MVLYLNNLACFTKVCSEFCGQHFSISSSGHLVFISKLNSRLHYFEVPQQYVMYVVRVGRSHPTLIAIQLIFSNMKSFLFEFLHPEKFLDFFSSSPPKKYPVGDTAWVMKIVAVIFIINSTQGPRRN